MCPLWSSREKDRDLFSICDLSSLFVSLSLNFLFSIFFLFNCTHWTIQEFAFKAEVVELLFTSFSLEGVSRFLVQSLLVEGIAFHIACNEKGLKLETSFCSHSCLILFHVSFACVFDVFFVSCTCHFFATKWTSLTQSFIFFVSHHTGYSEVTTVEGREGILHCGNISHPKFGGEDPILILWYRGKAGIPIFTVDARNGTSTQIPSPEFEGRAIFDSATRPPSLRIKTIFREDEERYRCRCDYRKSKTQNFLINLTVVGECSQFETGWLVE